MMPLFLSIVGVAIDGGLAFEARRDLQNLADGAARAGVMQVDGAVYRDSGGQRLVLDQPGAREAAATYLNGRPGLSATIRTDERRVLVSVRRDVPLTFLRIAGFERVRIEATAPAEVRVGVGGAGS
jgi:Flp pilus assembly protein TadG